eukprot:gene3305-biopygen11959
MLVVVWCWWWCVSSRRYVSTADEFTTSFIEKEPLLVARHETVATSKQMGAECPEGGVLGEWRWLVVYVQEPPEGRALHGV